MVKVSKDAGVLISHQRRGRDEESSTLFSAECYGEFEELLASNAQERNFLCWSELRRDGMLRKNYWSPFLQSVFRTGISRLLEGAIFYLDGWERLSVQAKVIRIWGNYSGFQPNVGLIFIEVKFGSEESTSDWLMGLYWCKSAVNIRDVGCRFGVELPKYVNMYFDSAILILTVILTIRLFDSFAHLLFSCAWQKSELWFHFLKKLDFQAIEERWY